MRTRLSSLILGSILVFTVTACSDDAKSTIENIVDNCDAANQANQNDCLDDDTSSPDGSNEPNTPDNPNPQPDSPNFTIVSSEGAYVYPNEKIQLTAQNNGNDYNKTVIWKSLNEDILVVDQNGVVTGVQPGNTHIYFTADDINSAFYKVHVPEITQQPPEPGPGPGDKTGEQPEPQIPTIHFSQVPLEVDLGDNITFNITLDTNKDIEPLSISDFTWRFSPSGLVKLIDDQITTTGIGPVNLSATYKKKKQSPAKFYVFNYCTDTAWTQST